jgi:hypothetical protein
MGPLPQPAKHANPNAYWRGGDYALNLSFSTLRDKQWARLVQAVWEHPALDGPFAERYIPGASGERAPIQTPEQTATWIQHGRLEIDDFWVGCAVQATRSLFECVTVQVPIGMFDGLTGETGGATAATIRLEALDHLYQNIAVAVFEMVPFELANLGYLSECQLVTELQFNTRRRLELLGQGDVFIRDDILRLLNVSPEDYPAIRPDLRWIPPGR